MRKSWALLAAVVGGPIRTPPCRRSMRRRPAPGARRAGPRPAARGRGHGRRLAGDAWHRRAGGPARAAARARGPALESVRLRSWLGRWLPEMRIAPRTPSCATITVRGCGCGQGSLDSPSRASSVLVNTKAQSTSQRRKEARNSTISPANVPFWVRGQGQRANRRHAHVRSRVRATKRSILRVATWRSTLSAGASIS